MRGLLISLVSVVLVAVVGLGWLVTQVYNQLDNKPSQIDASYMSMGSQLAKTFDTLDPAVLLAHWPNSGAIKLSLANEDEFPLPADLLAKLHAGEAVLLEDNQHLLINYFLPNRNEILTLAVANPPVKDDKTSFILTLIFYCGLIIILVLWLYPLLRRLILLQESARDFGAGDLNARIAPSRWSYICTLEAAFNQMAERVQTLLADNRLLSRAVSHDLKTPLARLRFGFEMLEETQDPQQSARYLQRIGEDLSTMESLIARLLEYAKLEEGQIKLEFQPININALLLRLCERIPESDRQIQLQLEPAELWINADSHYLAMLINNLLTNALHYSRQRIIVSTQRRHNYIDLNISDDGPGIPHEERRQVLKPFVRGQASLGHGMGLAIVERIAAWHKIKVTLTTSIPLGGLSASALFAATEPSNVTN
ncbi:MAG TPA: ATP-binding protein [Cellvibrionaceae bacterium]